MCYQPAVKRKNLLVVMVFVSQSQRPVTTKGTVKTGVMRQECVVRPWTSEIVCINGEVVLCDPTEITALNLVWLIISIFCYFFLFQYYYKFCLRICYLPIQ